MFADNESLGMSRNLRAGREGVQFERYLRILSFLLHSWCQYRGERHDDGEPADRFRAIQFDKFVTLVSRLWDALYEGDKILSLGPSQDEIVIAASRDVVTFPCPLIELPGKHGPGRAMYDGQKKPVYVIPFLYKLQQDDLIQYFTVSPPDASGGAKEAPSHPETTIASAFSITNSSQILEVFERREIDVLRDLERAIRRLNQSEIRALGTHQSQVKTIEAIRWEFRSLQRHRIPEVIRTAIQQGIPFKESVQEWIEYASEARSKADGNKKTYDDGWNLMEADLTDDGLRRVFMAVQRPAAEIWEDSQIRDYRLMARRMVVLGEYFAAVSSGLSNKRGRSAQLLERAKENCDKECVGAGLPSSLEEMFSIDGKLLPAVKALLIAKLDESFEKVLRFCRAQ